MNTMQCQINGHNGEEIIAACMDKLCENQRLCCLQCIGELHNSHQKKCVQIKKLNLFISQVSKQQIDYPKSCSLDQKQIIQKLENLGMLISQFQKIIMEKIEIIKKHNLQVYLCENRTSQQGMEYWNRLIEGILQHVEVDNFTINIATPLNGINQEFIKLINESEESLKTMTKQIAQTQLKNDIPIQQNIRNLFFKEDRKNSLITLINGCTIIKNGHEGCLAMAYANDGFDPNLQSYQFAFNIHYIAGFVAVGVGNDEVNNVPSYEFTNWQQLGHGQYLNNYGGLTFHHTDSEINDKWSGLQFDDGDTIQIQYDHKTKLLEFRRQSDHDTVVKMLITDMTKKLYPCAVLFYTNEKVQLVEY